MKELILASNNLHKVEEIKSILNNYSLLSCTFREFQCLHPEETRHIYTSHPILTAQLPHK